MADFLSKSNSDQPEDKFGLYSSGGSVWNGLYIKRPADDRLFELCRRGEYANVFAPRQIGKSSLMDATIERLEKAGIHTVRLDLNGIGTPTEAASWYLGLLIGITDALDLRIDLFKWWNERAYLSEANRLNEFFERVLLKELVAPVVIFVDEIDTTLSLPYTDDFFAAIRSLYIARTSRLELRRLSFVLLGVATSGELVKDANRTPYNIGENVEMTDFTLQEAFPLTAALTQLPVKERDSVLKRVLYWTNGHPYLTTKALHRLNELDYQPKQTWVDETIKGLFMGTFSNADNQVEFVRKMLRNDPPRLPRDQTVLLLQTYLRVWKNQKVEDERQSVVKNHLKLSGAVQLKDGYFVVRNRIYRQVFNGSWVKKQQEVVSFVAALSRLAPLLLLGGLVFVLVTVLALIAFFQFQNAETNKVKADANAATAVAERNQTQLQTRKNQSLGLAGTSRNLATTRPDLALLLAEQAIHFQNNPQAESALREILHVNSNLQKYLNGHIGIVRSVAFSPDAKTLASASDDSTIILWNVTTGQLIKVLGSGSAKLSSVVFNPDGKTLASGSFDNTITLWDVATGQILKTFKGHTGSIWGLAFSPDGKLIASASNDKTVIIWDVATSQPIKTLSGHFSAVNSVSFSSDNKILASASDDTTIILWDVATGKPIKVLKPDHYHVTYVAFSPDDKTLAATFDDSTVILWDVTTNDFKPLKGHSDVASSVAFSPDGKTLVSASKDTTLILWDVLTAQPIQILRGHADSVNAVAFSSDGKNLASASDDKSVILWGINPTQPFKIFGGHVDKVNGVAFSPDGKILASASDDATIVLTDPSNGQTLKTLKGHKNIVYGVAFSPDGKTLASASGDSTLIIWDVARGQILKTFKGHTGPVWDLAFSPDGKTLASASNDATVILWNISSGQKLKTLEPHAGSVYGVAFSPDGKILASASADKTIILWDVNDAESSRILKGHTDLVGSVAFSPDGKILASGSQDHTVKLWDVRSGNLLKSLPGGYWKIAFAPNGATIASEAYPPVSNAAVIWDVRTGEVIKTINSYSGQINSLAFAPDSKSLAFGVSGKSAIEWSLDIEGEGCKVVRRNLTWGEWQQYIGTEEKYSPTCSQWPLPSDLPADQKAVLTPVPTP